VCSIAFVYVVWLIAFLLLFSLTPCFFAASQQIERTRKKRFLGNFLVIGCFRMAGLNVWVCCFLGLLIARVIVC
jgi:hypothetical protein